MYILACDKTQQTYETIFNAVLSLEPNIKPRYIITDFERAAINAINKYFPESDSRGCFFHFSQSIFRHIIQIGLKTVYSEDPMFALYLRYFAALAFLPINKVVNGFELIVAEKFFEEDDSNPYNFQIQNLIEYFELTFIGRATRTQGRKQPLFPINLWNIHDLVLNKIPRTTIQLRDGTMQSTQQLAVIIQTFGVFCNLF